MPDIIPVVYICDENYVMPACVSIQSLYENKRNSAYEIYIIGVDISKDSEKKLKSINLKGININLLNVSNKYETLNTTHEAVTKAALFKFDIPKIFENKDKILYIDCDTICLGDLEELYNQNIEDYYAAVVKDLTAVNVYEEHKRLGTRSYFNSGVMLLNLKKLREENIPEKLLNYKINSTDTRYMDQDCFNVVFDGAVLFVDSRFNYLTSNSELSDVNVSEPLILHFTPKKPWKTKESAYKKKWNFYFKKSVCKREKLERDMRKYLLICKEKSGNKRIIHFFGIKISYKKTLGGAQCF